MILTNPIFLRRALKTISGGVKSRSSLLNLYGGDRANSNRKKAEGGLIRTLAREQGNKYV